MQECPLCRSSDVHHSRYRSKLEKWRNWLTKHVAYRCHKCGWRGWGPERGPYIRLGAAQSGRNTRVPFGSVTETDLDRLDIDSEEESNG